MSEYVYRVYEPFHDPAESGTYEWGTYSSHEDALKRVEAVWIKQGYPDPEKSEWGFYAYYQMDTYNIHISKVEIDRDTGDKTTGYT